MSEDKLLPCPFCGAAGDISQNEYGFWPSCSSCELCQFSGFSTRAEAIAAWNTRRDRQQLVSPYVAGYRAAVEQLLALVKGQLLDELERSIRECWGKSEPPEEK